MTGSPSPSPEAAENDAYPEWDETLAAIVGAGGTTLVLGGIDVGKTTFTRLLVNRAIAAGRRVAVLDADPGQSEIGPPACAGLAFADVSVAGLSELTPHALAFIGSLSPAPRLPEHITAVRRLADLAPDRLLVVDTSGYLHGPGARRMLQSEFDLLSPNNVVGLQRSDELAAILAPMRKRAGCRIYTPKIATAIVSKPPSLRTHRREARFAHYFRDAEQAQISIGDVAITGSWLGGGTPVAAHILRFLNETLGPTTIYHAETWGRTLGLMANRPVEPNSPAVGMILGQLRVKELAVTVAPQLKHLLVGMEASNGKILGLGILAKLDFRRGTIRLITPVRTPDAACVLHFGMHRIAPDGSDGGALKVGEL